MYHITFALHDCDLTVISRGGGDGCRRLPSRRLQFEPAFWTFSKFGASWYFRGDHGTSPPLLHVCGDLNGYFKPKPDPFLTLTVWFSCLDMKIISTVLLQDKTEKLNPKKLKVASSRNVKFQFICGLHKRTLPTLLWQLGCWCEALACPSLRKLRHIDSRSLHTSAICLLPLQGGYESVCWSVCMQDYTEITEKISIRLGWRTGLGPYLVVRIRIKGQNQKFFLTSFNTVR